MIAAPPGLLRMREAFPLHCGSDLIRWPCRIWPAEAVPHGSSGLRPRTTVPSTMRISHQTDRAGTSWKMFPPCLSPRDLRRSPERQLPQKSWIRPGFPGSGGIPPGCHLIRVLFFPQNRESCSGSRRRPVRCRTTPSGRSGEEEGGLRPGGEDQLLPGTGQTHVQKPALLLRICRAAAGIQRQRPLVQSRKEHRRKLQPLGTVNVISRTAPEAQRSPAARRRSASWPRTRAFQRPSKSPWNTAVWPSWSRAGEAPYRASQSPISCQGFSDRTLGSHSSARSSHASREPWPRWHPAGRPDPEHPPSHRGPGLSG